VKVLVTGAVGQLGVAVCEELQRRGIDTVAAARTDLDISNRTKVAEVVRDSRVDCIVNAAAMTDVDRCEVDEQTAFAINAHGVAHLAEAAADTGAHLLTVSTDYVFDGTKIGPYVESDDADPRSAYGRSKLAGEVAAGPQSTVVRTSWLSGAAGANIVATIRRLLAAGTELSFVTDQVGCPTFTADLTPALVDLALDRWAGIVHVTNRGAVSWYEFASEVARQLGADPGRVRPIRTSELIPPRPAERPANSVLCNARFDGAGYRPLRDYQEPLKELLAAG